MIIRMTMATLPVVFRETKTITHLSISALSQKNANIYELLIFFLRKNLLLNKAIWNCM